MLQHQQQQQQQPVRTLNRRLEVDLEELRVLQCLENQLTLIDVRQPAELTKQEQIPGSLNIPREWWGVGVGLQGKGR